ncbi:MAG: RtcB family protein [Paramuribaculum sp.]|nr:RtcB family protein [Paramuribaculum sp.]
MIIKGKTTSAQIFTDSIEETALNRVKELCDHPAMTGVPIVQMPDVHAATSCNVGTAYPVAMYVNPDHVGVDIGCTISLHRLSTPVPEADYALLDHRIREVIPMGTEICSKNSLNEKDLFKFLNTKYQRARSCAPDLINDAPRIDARFITDFCRRIKLQEGIFYKSIGSLGGGNHFIEYGEGYGGEASCRQSEYWLTIHCGSRNLGVKVAGHWHNIAQNPKRANHIGYLWGDSLKGYLSDMVIAHAYALYNHIIIRDRIFTIFRKLCKAKCSESIFTTHNYIDISGEMPMLRKGAIDASEGKKVAIPFNMRDGIAICTGKGNPLWLNTAPHGAGRIMSRAQARKQLTLNEYEKSMTGIYSTSVCMGTIDESPMAYKPTDEILELIKPTVEIISFIKPRLNIKDKEE